MIEAAKPIKIRTLKHQQSNADRPRLRQQSGSPSCELPYSSSYIAS